MRPPPSSESLGSEEAPRGFVAAGLMRAGLITYLFSGLSLIANLVTGVVTARALGPGGRGITVSLTTVSQLTGFPFEKGLAKIYRVDRQGRVSVYASGLTNVTDLAFGPGGHLYAVQISSEGLLTGPIGSVVRIPKGGGHASVVAGGLFAPYGIAITGRTGYVTTGSVAPGGGQVIALHLR